MSKIKFHNGYSFEEADDPRTWGRDVDEEKLEPFEPEFRDEDIEDLNRGVS